MEAHPFLQENSPPINQLLVNTSNTGDESVGTTILWCNRKESLITRIHMAIEKLQPIATRLQIDAQNSALQEHIACKAELKELQHC